MGLTFQTGALADAIKTDSSNNVGIGGAVDASYKLKVTGTTLTTGAATFSNSITASGQGTFTTATTIPLIAETTGGNSGLMIKTSSSTTNWLVGGQYNVINGFEITPSTAAGGTTFTDPVLIINSTRTTRFRPSSDRALRITGTTSTEVNLAAYQNFTENIRELRIVGSTIFFNTGDGSNSTGSERMKITEGGVIKASPDGVYPYATSGFHVFKGITSGDNCVGIVHSATTNPYGPFISFQNAAPNNNSQYFLAGSDNVASRFYIFSSGSMYNVTGTYGTLSDIKLKENIVDATPKLQDILQLKVRNFNFKVDPDRKQIGFIAQEFEEVFPNMIDISVDKDTGEETKGIKTAILIPILVKAIQELSAKVTALENKS